MSMFMIVAVLLAFVALSVLPYASSGEVHTTGAEIEMQPRRRQESDATCIGLGVSA